MGAVAEVMLGAVFCANPRCVLHVRVGEAAVRGAGEWAVRPDGIVTSRRPAAGTMLCDVCARALDQSATVRSDNQGYSAEEGS